MRDRVTRAWPSLLLFGAGALVLAAFATLIGNGALSRFSGTVAWMAASAGVLLGLLTSGSDNEARH